MAASPKNVHPRGRAPTPAGPKEWLLPYLSFRAALHEEVWRENWTSRFMRPGLLLIALFEIASIAASSLLVHTQGRYLPFEIFNAVAAFACLLFLWNSRFEHWRAAAFCFCVAILVAANYLSFITHRTEPLLMAVMLLLFGAGALVPWNAKWQTALTILCLGWFTVNAVWLPNGQQADSLDRWLALLAAAGLAQVGTARNEHQRREFETQVKAMSNQSKE